MKKAKKILVTGGAGFIGSHLVDRLVKTNKVVVIDNLLTGKRENLNPKAKFYKLDICNSKIESVFKKEKPDVLFHLAAQIDVRKSVNNPIIDNKINVLGSLNIIQEFFKVNKKGKVIFTSTGGAIYGDASVVPTSENYPENPLSPYGIAKLTIDKYLNYYYKVFGFQYVSLRLANVYGPRQNSKGEAGVIAIFTDKMINKEQLIVNGDGRQTRDFIYVDDVVEANILALGKNKIGVFNIGTAKETNINIVFKKIKKLTNSNCKEIHVPEKSGEQKRSCLNFSKASKELKWKPKHDLDRGLKETVGWFKRR